MVFQDPFASLDPRCCVRALLKEALRYGPHRMPPTPETGNETDNSVGSRIATFRLFRQVPVSIPPEQLTQICSDLSRLRFHAGAIELALAAAAAGDPENLGLSYANDGCPANVRLHCMPIRVPLALFVISHGVGGLGRAGWTGSTRRRVPLAHGLLRGRTRHARRPARHRACPDRRRYVPPDACARLSLLVLTRPMLRFAPVTAAAEAMRRSVYQRALASKDELFHVTLYEWLLQEGAGQTLLMDVRGELQWHRIRCA